MTILTGICAFIHFVKILQLVECSIKQTFFHRNEEKYLANHVIKTTQADNELQCSSFCLSDGSCASVNYKKTGIGKGRCELNSKTLQEISDADGCIRNPEFNHLYILKESLEKNALPPKSCKDIQEKSRDAASGLYDISIDNTAITVFCDMVLHGGGFTFIPKSAVKEGTLPNLVPQLFTDHSEALLYIQNKDGSQEFTHIKQLKEESQTPLVVLQNAYTGGTGYRPLNYKMLDYLYLSTSTNIGGFRSNNINVTYRNNESFPIRNYFAFFPNHREQTADGYHSHNLVYERRGVSVDWRNTGIHASVKLPSDFFFLTEMHYGGGGCYTSSDRWNEANGTAIGLR